MGNNHSTANHPNRLTKPKTNTNSPNPALVVADSPVSISSKYANLSASNRQQIRDSLLSPIGTRHVSTALPSKVPEAVCAVDEPTPRVRGRSSTVVSRTNSRANSKANTRSNSLSCFGSRHGSSTKLNELHGPRIAVGPDTDIDMDQAIRRLHDVKKNGTDDDIAALRGSMDQSDQEGLSRRTSMRNGSTSSLTRRRSLVQTPGVATRISPVEGRRRTWNSWKPPMVDPEEEAKWAPATKGRFTGKPLRAFDLAEEGGCASSLNAQTPGEMEYTHLGSLKLGTLSIVNGAPSPAASTKVVSSKTRVELNNDYFSMADEESSPLTMKSPKKRGHIKSKSAVLPATGGLYGDRPKSPSKTKPHPITEFREQKVVKNKVVGAAMQSSDFRGRAELSGQSASRYTQGHQTVITQGSLRKSANEDEGFVSDGTSPAKDEIAANFSGTMFDAPTTADEASGSTLFPATTPSPTSESQKLKVTQRPQARTADSGYSSGGSLRVGNNIEARRPSNTHDNHNGAFSDSHPRRPSAQGPIAYQAAIPSTKAELCEAVPTSQIVVPDRSIRSSTSESIISPQTPRFVTSKSSFDSTNSANTRRLHRRRPSQPEVPVVQSCQPIPEGNIPDVPEGVRMKFTRRLSHTPEMECLTRTYPSKDHVITAEPSNNVPAESVGHYAPLVELEPERPSTPPPHGRKRSLSLFRRKSVIDKELEAEAELSSPAVVDLGSIASSLGSSPYDIAMANGPRKMITSPTHPHQLGSALPRAKSMVGMGPEMAAEHARMHSRDRAMIERDQPHQRRRSHQNLRADVGEAKASRRRPQSSAYDIPPVPVIDTSKLKVPHSAKPRLENADQNQTADIRSRNGPQLRGELTSQYYVGHELNHQNSSQLNWDAHAQSWSRRRKSIGEGLRTPGGVSETTTFTVNSHNTLQPVDHWGRYSGGLDYNYERGAGVHGSAGTRQMQSHASQKSMHWKNQYGVDLTDVPIMLQRVA